MEYSSNGKNRLHNYRSENLDNNDVTAIDLVIQNNLKIPYEVKTYTRIKPFDIKKNNSTTHQKESVQEINDQFHIPIKLTNEGSNKIEINNIIAFFNTTGPVIAKVLMIIICNNGIYKDRINSINKDLQQYMLLVQTSYIQQINDKYHYIINFNNPTYKSFKLIDNSNIELIFNKHQIPLPYINNANDSYINKMIALDLTDIFTIFNTNKDIILYDIDNNNNDKLTINQIQIIEDTINNHPMSQQKQLTLNDFTNYDINVLGQKLDINPLEGNKKIKSKIKQLLTYNNHFNNITYINKCFSNTEKCTHFESITHIIYSLKLFKNIFNENNPNQIINECKFSTQFKKIIYRMSNKTTTLINLEPTWDMFKREFVYKQTRNQLNCYDLMKILLNSLFDLKFIQNEISVNLIESDYCSNCKQNIIKNKITNQIGICIKLSNYTKETTINNSTIEQNQKIINNNDSFRNHYNLRKNKNLINNKLSQLIYNDNLEDEKQNNNPLETNNFGNFVIKLIIINIFKYY